MSGYTYFIWKVDNIKITKHDWVVSHLIVYYIDFMFSFTGLMSQIYSVNGQENERKLFNQ